MRPQRRRSGASAKSTPAEDENEGSNNNEAAVAGENVAALDEISLSFEGELGEGVGDDLNVSGMVLNMENNNDAPTDKAQAKSKPNKKQTAKKKKGKEQPQKKSKKKKKTEDDPATVKKKEKMLKLAAQDAKEEFEEQRDEILAQVPMFVRDMFGQIGFAKWSKAFLPALVMNPYRVPPGDARNIWLKMFEKMKENGRPLEKMSLLVYWYGEEQPSSYYSLVPQSNFVPYEKATKKMLDLAKNPQKKLDQGKKLSPEEQQKIRGMKQLEEDKKKDAHKRSRGSIKFAEGYQLLSLNDFDDLEEGSLGLDTDDEDDVKEEQAPKQAKKASVSKTSSKPKKKKPELSDDDQSFDEEAETDEAELDNDENDLDYESEDDASPKKKKAGRKTTKKTQSVGKRRSTKAKTPRHPKEPPVEDGEGDTQQSSSKKRKRAAAASPDDDEDAEELQTAKKRASKKKKASKSTNETKEVVSETAKPKRGKKKNELNGGTGDNGESEKSPKTKRKRHPGENEADADDATTEPKKAGATKVPKKPLKIRKRFKKNEVDLGPVLRKWRTAIQESSVEDIYQCLDDIMEKLEDLCAPFLETYNISGYVKETKILLKQKDADLQKLSDLRKSIRDHYKLDKKKSASEDFNARESMQFPELAEPFTSATGPTENDKEEEGTAENGRAESQESVVPDSQSTAIGIDSPGKLDHAAAVVTESSVDLSHDAKSPAKEETSVLASSGAARSESKTNGETKASWTQTPVQAETTNPQRLLGIEFLRQMADELPEGTVDANSVAVSVESALFEWAGGKTEKRYWDRLHSIVAGVVGDPDPGPLMHSIASGEFQTPSELVALPPDKLHASFKGEEEMEETEEADDQVSPDAES